MWRRDYDRSDTAPSVFFVKGQETKTKNKKAKQCLLDLPLCINYQNLIEEAIEKVVVQKRTDEEQSETSLQPCPYDERTKKRKDVPK